MTENGSSKVSLEGYVDVAERIRKFYEQYEDGRLTREDEPEFREVDGRLFIIYRALAYRTPDDKLPGKGMAWEPFPGPTPFTKDSELQNAETAAWGRAIVAVGILAQDESIASHQEVAARGGGSRGGGAKTVTEKQVEKFILPNKKRYSLSDESFTALLASFGVSKVEELPIDKADDFVKAMAQPVAVGGSDVPVDAPQLDPDPNPENLPFD